MQQRFRRAVLGLEMLMALLVLGTVCLLLFSVYRNSARFLPVDRHIEYVTALQGLEQEAQAILDQSVPEGTKVSAESIAQLRARLAALEHIDAHLNLSTPEQLRLLYGQIDRLGSDTAIPAVRILEIINQTTAGEVKARQLLLQSISMALRQEKRLMTLIVATIPLLLIGALIMFRFYVVTPARRIADLLADFGTDRFGAVEIGEASPVLRPILDNYNRLVMRLMLLESERHQKQETLQHQVQLASGSLVRLQRTLANAEKLAVAGEIAAGIAHELRNPLAGIRATLDNLQAEMPEPEQQARLNLVIAELKRMTALLNHLLEQSDGAAEAPIKIPIAAAIDEVVQLAKFQLPETIRIDQTIEQELSCTLPEDRFRQAMLNLILNSGQALGKQPGRIEICGRQKGNRIEIIVTDNGPGFPDEVLASGPQPFFSRRDQGTGLGLAIVLRFVRDLGGRLTISNIEPHGARAMLDFPYGG